MTTTDAFVARAGKIVCGWIFNATATAVIFGCLQYCPSAQAQDSGKPDIVFVISDDQGWGDYSFMGHPHIQTPNIDSLAHESLVFTRGYVPDSLCRPSLASIITGLYPHQHGIVGNDPPPRDSSGNRGRLYRSAEYQQVIDEYLRLHIDKLTTLPDRLSERGYVSLQTGKWWEGNATRGGFDSGMTHGDHNRGGRHGDIGLTIGRETMQPIEQFIKRARNENKPYFLWYAPMLPHTPHDPDDQLIEKYKPNSESESVAKYWAMCERFDSSVGELREMIRLHGRPRDTLIVYVCDNGWINLPDRSAYAPKSKRSQYDGGVRTPIMIHWPGKVEAKRDEQHLASSIDLVPTVLSLLGEDADRTLPGLDLTNSRKLDSRQAVFGEIFEHDIVSMDNPSDSLMYRWVIHNKWKLIVPNPSRTENAQAELYDLIRDPFETANLATSQPAEVLQLQQLLDGWWSGK